MAVDVHNGFGSGIEQFLGEFEPAYTIIYVADT